MQGEYVSRDLSHDQRWAAVLADPDLTDDDVLRVIVHHNWPQLELSPRCLGHMQDGRNRPVGRGCGRGCRKAFEVADRGP